MTAPVQPESVAPSVGFVTPPTETRRGGLRRIIPAVASERVMALATPAARLLLVGSVLMAAASALANLAASTELSYNDRVGIAMHASTVATLIFALIAGLYSATTDHRFGLVDQRLLSEPNRGLVYVAKSVVAAGLGFAYGVVGAVTAVGVASGYFATQSESFDVSSALVFRPLLGIVIAAPLMAILGVAVGSVVRNQPIAIGGSLAWLLIIEPVVIVGLPTVGRWLPGGSGLALTNAPDENLLAQGPAAAVLVGYMIVGSFMATRLFARADV